MNVEIWSDIACPWCYIGKRRFEAALARLEHRDEVQVTWRSFELDPSAPGERDGDRAERLAEKYGMTVERPPREGALDDRGCGRRGPRLPLRPRPHRLDVRRPRMVHLAAEHGLQDAMKERLLRAYFTEGELPRDHETLVRLATPSRGPRG